jgi:hypothetical protein
MTLTPEKLRDLADRCDADVENMGWFEAGFLRDAADHIEHNILSHDASVEGLRARIEQLESLRGRHGISTAFANVMLRKFGEGQGQ